MPTQEADNFDDLSPRHVIRYRYFEESDDGISWFWFGSICQQATGIYYSHGICKYYRIFMREIDVYTGKLLLELELFNSYTGHEANEKQVESAKAEGDDLRRRAEIAELENMWRKSNATR